MNAIADSSTTPSAVEPNPPLSPPDIARELASCLHLLPTLPLAAIEVLKAFHDDQHPVQTSIDMIELDPALALRTLRLANSSFYGVAGRVITVSDAVRILGLRAVAGLVTASALIQLRPEGTGTRFRHDKYWQHSVTTGLIARELAARFDWDADVAFLVGLLHDIGLLVIATRYPDISSEIMGRAGDIAAPIEVHEMALLGFTHTQAGAWLATWWKLPPLIVSAIHEVHDPVVEDGTHRLSMGALLHLADALAVHMHRETGLAEIEGSVSPEVWRLAGLDTAQLDHLRTFTRAQFEQWRHAFDLPEPGSLSSKLLAH